MVAGLPPLVAQREGLFAVRMVALVVVGNEHEGRRAVLGIAQGVVVHRRVSAAVAERQHGHLAYLLRNLQHLVRLQVLDDEFVGAHKVFLAAVGVVHALLRALTGGAQFHVHADDAVWLDADAFYQCAADEAVAARYDVVGEALVAQILKHLEHGLEETLAVGHAREAVGGLLGVGLHVGIELGQRHATVGLRGGVGVLHVEVVR